MGPKEFVRRATAHSPSYYLGRFQAVRRTVSLLAATRDRLSGKKPVLDPQRPESPFRDMDVNKSVVELSQDAFAPGFVLPPDMVQEIAAFARTANCSEGHIPTLFHYGDIQGGLSPEGKPTATAHIRSPLECPAIARLSNDAVLDAVVRGYLGYLPRKRDVRLYWSFASSHSDDTRRGLFQTIDYHFDVHDYNFCYAHFYITDTDRHSGAHCLVRGSHRKKPVSWLLGSAQIRRGDRGLLRPAGYCDCRGAGRIRICGRYIVLPQGDCSHGQRPPAAADPLPLTSIVPTCDGLPDGGPLVCDRASSACPALAQAVRNPRPAFRDLPCTRFNYVERP